MRIHDTFFTGFFTYSSSFSLFLNMFYLSIRLIGKTCEGKTGEQLENSMKEIHTLGVGNVQKNKQNSYTTRNPHKDTDLKGKVGQK